MEEICGTDLRGAGNHSLHLSYANFLSPSCQCTVACVSGFHLICSSLDLPFSFCPHQKELGGGVQSRAWRRARAMQAVTEAALQVVLRRVLSQYVVSAERASDGASVSVPSPATLGSGGEHSSGRSHGSDTSNIGSNASGSGGGGGVEQLRVQLKNGAVVLRHLELNLQSVLSLDPRRMRVHRAYAHALHVRVPNVFSVKEILSDPYVVTLEGVELKLEVNGAEAVVGDPRSRSSSASSVDARQSSDAAAADATHTTNGEVKRLMGNVVRGILVKLARVCGEIRGLRASILHNGNEFVLSIGTVKLLEADELSVSAGETARNGAASAAAATKDGNGDDMDDSMFGRAVIMEGVHMSLLLSRDKSEGLLQCASLRCTALVPTDEHMDQLLADEYEDSNSSGNTGDPVYGRCTMDVSMSPLAVTASFSHMRAMMAMIRAMRKDETAKAAVETASQVHDDLHRVKRSTRSPSTSLAEPHVAYSPGGSTVWGSLSSIVVPLPDGDPALPSTSGSVVSNQIVPEAPSVPLRLTSRIHVLSGDVTILKPSPYVHSLDLVWNELTIDKTCESPSVLSCISVRLDASIVSKFGDAGAAGVSSQGAFDRGDAGGSDRRRLRKDRKPTRVTVCNFDGRYGNPGLRFKMVPESFDLDSIMRLDTVSGQIGYPSGFYGHVMAAWRESSTSGARDESRHASTTGRGSIEGDANSKRISNLLDIVSHLRHQLDTEAKSNETMQGDIAALTQKLHFAEDQLMKAEKSLLSSTRAASAANAGMSMSIGTAKASDLSFDIEEGSSAGSKLGTPSKPSFKPLTALARPLLYCLPQRVVAIFVIPVLRLVDNFSSRLSELLNRPVMRLSVFLYFLAVHLVLFIAVYVGISYVIAGAGDGSGDGSHMRILQRTLRKVVSDGL